MAPSIGCVELIRAGSQLVLSNALDEALEAFHTAHTVFACPNRVQETWRTSAAVLERASYRVQQSSSESESSQRSTREAPPDLYEHAACDCGPSAIGQPVVPSRTSSSNPTLMEAIILYNKALTYQLKDNTSAAETLYQSARSFIDRLLETTEDTESSCSLIEVSVRCYNNLGSLRYRLDDAHQLFAMATKLAELQPNRIEYATVLSNSCRVQWLSPTTTTNRNYDSIRRDLQTIADIRRQAYGDRHPQAVVARFNLALAHFHEPSIAVHHLDAYLQVASSPENRLNPIPALTHILIIKSSSSVSKGPRDSQLVAALCALSERRHAVGADSGQLPALLSQVGTQLFHQQNFEAALYFFVEELRVEKLNETVCTATYNNIGRIYQELGEMDDAVIYYQLALSNEETLKASQQQDIESTNQSQQRSNANILSTVWYNLGVIQDKRGAREVAIGAFQTSLELRKTILGSQHTDIACLHYNIAVLQIEQDLLEEASASLMEAVRIRLQQTNSAGQLTDHQIMQTLHNLSIHHKTRGNIQRVLECYHMTLCLIDVSKELDETARHQESGSILRLMAEVLSEIGQNERALEHSVNSVQRLNAARSQSNGKDCVLHVEHLVCSLLLLGSLYHELCEPIEAVRILENAADVVKQTATKADMQLMPAPRSLSALLEVTTMLKLNHCAPQA